MTEHEILQLEAASHDAQAAFLRAAVRFTKRGTRSPALGRIVELAKEADRAYGAWQRARGAAPVALAPVFLLPTGKRLA